MLCFFLRGCNKVPTKLRQEKQREVGGGNDAALKLKQHKRGV